MTAPNSLRLALLRHLLIAGQSELVHAVRGGVVDALQQELLVAKHLAPAGRSACECYIKH